MLSVKRVFQKSLPGLELLLFCSASLCWPAWQSNLTPDVTGAQQQKKKPFLAVTSSFKEGLTTVNSVIACATVKNDLSCLSAALLLFVLSKYFSLMDVPYSYQH